MYVYMYIIYMYLCIQSIVCIYAYVSYVINTTKYICVNKHIIYIVYIYIYIY